MSPKITGRFVGTLFLLAFVAYLTGTALVDSGIGVPEALAEVHDHQRQLSAGALLMLVNSAVVVGIGLLSFPILRPHGELSAYAYLLLRTIEAVLLAVGIVLLLLLVPLAREHAGGGAEGAAVLPALARVAQDGNGYAYQLGMIALGVAGLFFCRILLRARLVPRPFALWGLLGYAVLLAGAVLEVLGYGVGLALSVPGGLFEVALGVLLVLRGFPGTDPAPAESGTGSPAPLARSAG
ncbi:DUF4386 domain-containing protein [Plantactinospora sp. WMMC1484]|uniref:DUF4386 domain-containing protein n=1 Tax=Plantactinospora sp. WMMC1484 TaxID=3404122 RepID=UPI003BF47CE8